MTLELTLSKVEKEKHATENKVCHVGSVRRMNKIFTLQVTKYVIACMKHDFVFV